MIFFGAGGHAKVVIEAWLASGGKVSAIFDDNKDVKELLTYPVNSRYEPTDFRGKELCISIGFNLHRQEIARSIEATFKSVIHPAAIVSPTARVGNGSAILAGAILNASCVIGDHAIINTSSVIEHDCIVNDFVHVSPGAVVCGGVAIGEGAHVGAGATVIPNRKIGKWAVLGAGSVIIEDVPDFAVVVGVPGKVIKFNKI